MVLHSSIGVISCLCFETDNYEYKIKCKILKKVDITPIISK